MFELLRRGVAVNCEKVNFKAFDFTDGTLLWEALLYDPTIATNGNVYSVLHDAKFTGYEQTLAAFSSTNTVNLPSRTFSPGALHDLYPYSIDRRDGSSGEVLGNSGWYGCTRVAPGDTGHTVLHDSMAPSRYLVNDSGDKIVVSNSIPILYIWVTDPTPPNLTITYRLGMFEVSSADITLAMDSLATPASHSDATFTVTDNAAAVQSAISTAFGSNVTSVAVSGASLATSGLEITIEWDSDRHYLDTLEVDYGGSHTLIGNLYLRNYRTGIRGTSVETNTPHSGGVTWDSDGDVFRQGHNPLNITQMRFESWDTSATPWTLNWSSLDLASKTPIVPDESTMYDLQLAAAGGICAISFPFTSGLTDPFTNRMSVITWNNDGTGQQDYSNSGNILTGYFPDAISIQDGGDDLCVLNKQWRDVQVQATHGDAYTDAVYRAQEGDPVRRLYSGASPSVVYDVNLGDFSATHLAGFTDTAVAFCDMIATKPQFGETLTACTDEEVGRWVVEESSGLGSPSILDWWKLRYDVHTEVNSLMDANTEWRLRFDDNGVERRTGWLSFSASLANLNTELTTLFGTNGNGDQNVLASSGTAASPVTVPLFAQGPELRVFGAQDAADEATLGTDPYFTIDVGTAVAARGEMPHVNVDVQNFTAERANTFGALKWSDGSVIWSRHFNQSGPATSVLQSQLESGRLYVLSTKQCKESNVLLLLAITGCSVTEDVPGMVWTITLTLSVTNKTGGAVDITPDASEWSPSGFIFSPSLVSISEGATGTITATLQVNATGDYTVGGTVTGNTVPASESFVSNSVSKVVTV